MSDIIRFKEIDSTNKEAKRQLLAGLKTDLCIIADLQQAGRGQHGRIWESDSGGIYASFIKQSVDVSWSTLEAYVLEVAHKVQAAIQAVVSVDLSIEWPNDIILAHKKVAGILIESAAVQTSTKIPYAIIGVGINVNQTKFPKILEHSAISLKQHLGKSMDKELLIKTLIDHV